MVGVESGEVDLKGRKEEERGEGEVVNDGDGGVLMGEGEHGWRDEDGEENEQG